MFVFVFSVLNAWTKISCKGAEPTPCSKHTTLLAVHNDWCSRPQCTDSPSCLQRAVSCPLSSIAQRGTRLYSNSARFTRESASSRSNFRNTEIDVCSHKKILLSVNGNNADTVHVSSVSPLSAAGDADIFYPRSGKTDSSRLLDDFDASFSPAHGVTNPVAAAELTGIQVRVDGAELGYENHIFLDSNRDIVISAASVCSPNESFHGPISPSQVPNKSDTEMSSSDGGPKKGQHALAVSLLGTPTKSSCTSTDKRHDRSRQQSLVQHEESSWVEMEMFGFKLAENGSSSHDMLIIQDVEDGDVKPRHNHSFGECNEELNARTEAKKEVRLLQSAILQ